MTDQLNQDRSKTREAFDYCKTRFNDYVVDNGNESEMLGNKGDGVDYVVLNMHGRDDETNGIQTSVTLLATRYRNGEYEIIDIDRIRVAAPSLEKWKKILEEKVAKMDQQYKVRAFEKFRGRNR